MTNGVISNPPPLNRQPLGLLGYLGIKNGGKYPQTLAETLAPTLELSDLYYKAGQLSTSAASAVTGSLDNFYFFGATTADQSRVLMVHYAGIETQQFVATQELGISWRVTDQSQLVSTPIGDSDFLLAPVSNNARLIAGIRRPVLLYPGQLLGFSVNRLVLAAQPSITFTWFVTYTPLPL